MMPRHRPRFTFGPLTSLALGAGLLLASAALRAWAAEPAEERDGKIYFLEHRLLAKWTHESKGTFYEDLARGHAEQLIKTAHELLGAEFGSALRLRALAQPAAVLIAFPSPGKVPQCYFAAVVKTADGFRYFTAEKAEDIEGTGVKAAFCEWTADGSHRLLGFSKSAEEEWFLKRVTGMIEERTPPAASAPPGK